MFDLKFQAIAARDAMAKCLYGALFDWIVLQVNHALLSKKDLNGCEFGRSIGVLDIFGFEDFGDSNRYLLLTLIKVSQIKYLLIIS
jgi:myosin heavy subunit